MSSLVVVARPALGPRDPAPLSDPAGKPDGLWLESSAALPESAQGTTLDDALGGRFPELDVAACRAAEQVSATARFEPLLDGNPADLLALPLRYYLVKLLRVLTYFTQVRPLPRGGSVTFFGSPERDADYAELLRQLTERSGCRLDLVWQPGPAEPRPPLVPRSRVRTALASLVSAAEAFLSGRAQPDPALGLCGNPHLLRPLADVLRSRGARIVWLWDRFPLRHWLPLRSRGVRHVFCSPFLRNHSRETKTRAHVALKFADYDLGPLIATWLERHWLARGPDVAWLQSSVRAALARETLQALIVDEDASPLQRAALNVARAQDAPSYVLQHGLPCVACGFAPLKADLACVWGASSARQYRTWGIPADRLLLTGTPAHDALLRGPRPAAQSRGPQKPWRLLLLATVPPRPDRPDSAALAAHPRAYHRLLRDAFSVCAEFSEVELLVKPHPRAPHEPFLAALPRAFPTLRCRFVTSSLAAAFAQADLVLSCASSAGVEARLWGLPVIQLLPAAAADTVLPADEWDLQASCRTAEELRVALRSRLQMQIRTHREKPSADVFANLTRSAAANIADAVLERAATIHKPSGLPRRTSHPERAAAGRGS